MAYPGGRAVSIADLHGRRRKGRLLEGPWSAGSAASEVRDYARHARSMSARRLRQRVLALALAGSAVVAVTVIAAPRAVELLTKKPDTSLRAAVAARNQAASWIVRWVSDSAMISCDPLMCAVLRAHGVPPGRLARIGIDARDPEGSDVVVATQAIRKRFGGRLASVYAPAVPACFGAGPTRVAVRIVVSTGAAGRYRRALRADERARRAAGLALLTNPAISVAAPAAARDLATGAVDSRILMVLSVLDSLSPVTILGFGGAGPGASTGMPLLSVDITAGDLPNGSSAVTAAHARVETPVSLALVLRFLRAQIQPLQPASFRELTAPNGMDFVRIKFTAPTVMAFSGSP